MNPQQPSAKGLSSDSSVAPPTMDEGFTDRPSGGEHQKLAALLYLLEEPESQHLAGRAVSMLMDTTLHVLCKNRGDGEIGFVFFSSEEPDESSAGNVYFKAYLTTEAAQMAATQNNDESLSTFPISASELSSVASACEYPCGLKVVYERNGELRWTEFAPDLFEAAPRNETVSSFSEVITGLGLTPMTHDTFELRSAAQTHLQNSTGVLAAAAGWSEDHGCIILLVLQERNTAIEQDAMAPLMRDGTIRLVAILGDSSALTEFLKEARRLNGLIYARNSDPID
ncbi:MAG: hypothetical protein J5J00_16425 [Deltaproteobacteria bacterium]|nr:hypothetical protein [Deltaproteobacteria bacterium]